jgi:hypothetical protein
MLLSARESCQDIPLVIFPGIYRSTILYSGIDNIGICNFDLLLLRMWFVLKLAGISQPIRKHNLASALKTRCLRIMPWHQKPRSKAGGFGSFCRNITR